MMIAELDCLPRKPQAFALRSFGFITCRRLMFSSIYYIFRGPMFFAVWQSSPIWYFNGRAVFHDMLYGFSDLLSNSEHKVLDIERMFWYYKFIEQVY